MRRRRQQNVHRLLRAHSPSKGDYGCCPRKSWGYRTHDPDCVVGRLIAASGTDAVTVERRDTAGYLGSCDFTVAGCTDPTCEDCYPTVRNVEADLAPSSEAPLTDEQRRKIQDAIDKIRKINAERAEWRRVWAGDE